MSNAALAVNPDSKVAFNATVASVLLDAVRGCAALLVCLQHWRNLFFVNYNDIGHARIFWAPFYILCGAGHQAVIVFFVLSGYLIGGSVFRAIDKGNWSWSLYVAHRLSRLWLVLIPALIIGGIWDGSGIFLHLSPKLYAGAASNGMVSNVHQSLTMSAFLGNIFFLQGIWTPTFGSNGPLWSLANEFWYYLLFPLLLCCLRRSLPLTTRLVYTGAALGMACFMGEEIVLLFPVWLLGALLYRAPVFKSGLAVRTCCCLLYLAVLLGVCLYSKAGSGHTMFARMVADYFLAACTLVLIWVLLGAKNREQHALPERVARSLARFSYTLYLSHVPFLVFLCAILARDKRWSPDLKHMSIALVAFVAMLAHAWCLAWATEFKNERVRKQVESWIPTASQ